MHAKNRRVVIGNAPDGLSVVKPDRPQEDGCKFAYKAADKGVREILQRLGNILRTMKSPMSPRDIEDAVWLLYKDARAAANATRQLLIYADPWMPRDQHFVALMISVLARQSLTIGGPAPPCGVFFISCMLDS